MVDEGAKWKRLTLSVDTDFYEKLRAYADSARVDMTRVVQAATWDLMKHTRPSKFCPADSVPENTEVLK